MAIWGTESLLGRELKDTLAQRRDLWDDLRLLGRDPDSSTVSDIAGEAVLIQPGTEENLSDVDILYVCGEPGEPVDIPAGLPEHATTIILAGDEPIDGFPPVVAGVNSDVVGRAGQAATLLSAHPAAVALAQLLKPLADLGPESCTASVLLPSSTKGQEGIDELLAQTRSILAFQPLPEELFGCQLAFNIAPSSFPGGKIAETVREVLGDDKIRVAVQASIGGVFHSLLVGAHVRLAAPADEAAVRQALEASPSLEFAERPETLGPVDAAGSSSLHLGAIEASTAPNSFWLRAVMDNLTVGGALNAIRIAEAVLESDGYTM